VRAAQADLPILENPLGSNRSPEIDAMCDEFGVPRGSYWCGLWAARCWKKGGAQIPPIEVTATHNWHPAKAHSWYEWAKATGRFSHSPSFGAAPLYGTTAHVDHIGACVVALAPLLMDLEGNTSLTGFSREGWLTDLKVVNASRLVGFVSPEPIEASI
jgi:hypothetical protein